MKHHGLERLFTREDQRDVFRVMDDDLSGQIDRSEFHAWLDGDLRSVDGVGMGDAVRDLSGGPAASVDMVAPVTIATAESASDAYIESARSGTDAAEVTKVKQKLVHKVVDKRRLEKNEDGIRYTSEFMLNAFKQMDSNQSGQLTREEVHETFGTRGLDLGLTRHEVDVFVDAADLDKDGEISYSEMIKAMGVHDREPEYNAFFDGRSKTLQGLHEIVHAPFAFAKEYEAAVARNATEQAKLAEYSETVKAHDFSHHHEGSEDETTLLPAVWTLSAKPQTAPPPPGSWTGGAAGKRSGLADDRRRLRGSSLRGLNSTGGGDAARDDSDRSGSLVPASLRSAGELFADMQRTGAIQMSRVGTRLDPTTSNTTDYSRIGVGGDGVREDTGIYADSRSRFQTTSSSYFAPLEYKPNKPVLRPSVIPDSTMNLRAQADRRSRRQQRTDHNKQFTIDRIAENEAAALIDLDQRRRDNAERKYEYLKRVIGTDIRAHAKCPAPDGEAMQRKPHWPHFKKSWTAQHDNVLDLNMREGLTEVSRRHQGSAIPKYNHASVMRDDIGQSRFAQTSFSLGGSVVPDLHRTSKIGLW